MKWVDSFSSRLNFKEGRVLDHLNVIVVALVPLAVFGSMTAKSFRMLLRSVTTLVCLS